MRRVAQELNVGTMSLYHYVKTKDDLIAVMDDALMAKPSYHPFQEVGGARSRKSPCELMRSSSVIPWALVAMLSAPPGLNAMRHMEQCLEALAETSMSAKQKLTLLAMVDDFVFGHALREAASDATIDVEFAAAQMATGAFPRLAAVFRRGRIDAGKHRFEVGLRLLLEGNRP